MNHTRNQKGFTIVELLIVVVVIAILAAISIVAYTGITARANTSAALEAANSVKSVATAYNGANGSWPSSETQFINGGTNPLAKLPADITFTPTQIYSGAAAQAATFTDPKTVIVYACGATGMRIFYKNFSTGAGLSMDAGDCTTPPAAGATPII